MFARLGNAVVAHPWRVIALWVVAAVGLVVFAPNLDNITNNDQTQFLPTSHESAEATEIAAKAFPDSTGVSAIIVVKRQDGAELTTSDQATIGQIATSLQAKGIDKVTAVVTSDQMISTNKKIALISVALDGETSDSAVTGAVTEVRDVLPDLLEGGSLEAGVTGTAAIALDTMDKFSTAENRRWCRHHCPDRGADAAHVPQPDRRDHADPDHRPGHDGVKLHDRLGRHNLRLRDW